MGKLIDETGKRYGKVVVIGRAPDSGINKRDKARWYYRCDCGNIRTAAGCNLRSGNINSCGCLHGRPKDYSAFRQLIQSYKNNARHTNRKFDIPEDDFARLTKSNCFYCGASPAYIYRARKGERSGNIDYIYNGIDRIDSNGDYVLGNVVTACKKCNGAKTNMTQDEFFEWICRLIEHNKQINLRYGGGK